MGGVRFVSKAAQKEDRISGGRTLAADLTLSGVACTGSTLAVVGVKERVNTPPVNGAMTRVGRPGVSGAETVTGNLSSNSGAREVSTLVTGGVIRRPSMGPAYGAAAACRCS
jgi:hypothetical protein